MPTVLLIIMPVLCMLLINPATARDPSLDTLPRETFVPFVRQGNLILVNGSINHQPVTMIFDTGAAGCLFSKATLRSLGIRIPANLQLATVAVSVPINKPKLG